MLNRGKNVIALILLLPVLVSGAGKIDISYLEGRVIACCDIVVKGQVIPANVIIDLGLRHTMAINNTLARTLELDTDEEVVFDFYNGNKIAVDSYGFTDMASHQAFNRFYATELNNRIILAIIGLPAFTGDNGQVVLDITDKYLSYGQHIEPDQDWHRILLRQPGPAYYIDLEPYPDYVLKSFITTALYDTQIDSVCASIAGSDYGCFTSCYLDSFDIAPYVAIRPVKNFTIERAGYDAVVGNGFWQNFTVIFDPGRSYIYLKSKAGVIPDLSEQEYFSAVVDQDHERVMAYLDKTPRARLADEAASFLLQHSLANKVFDRQKIEKICNSFIDNNKPEQAAEKIIFNLEQLSDHENFVEIARVVYETMLHKIYNSRDLIIQRYRLESRLGALLLDSGYAREAYEHLLSAVFNQPLNSEINYQMGRYYLSQGNNVRAWSRFFRAAAIFAPYQPAIAELNKLNNSAEFRRSFSMTDARDMLSSFSPPAIYPRLADQQWTKADTVLLEYFVYSDTDELANLSVALEAINRFYPRSSFTSVCYMSGTPELSPLTNEYSRQLAVDYNAQSRPAVYVNGKPYGFSRVELGSPELIIDNLHSLKEHSCIPMGASAIAINDDIVAVSVVPPLCGYSRYEILLLESNVLTYDHGRLYFLDNVCRGQLHSGSSSTSAIEIDFSKEQEQNRFISYHKEQNKRQAFNSVWSCEVIDWQQCAVLAKFYDQAGVVCGYTRATLADGGGR